MLPGYRGPSPITGALKNGEDVTGISIMEVTPQLDAGPVFSQAIIKIDKRDNKDKLKFKLIKIGCPLLEATLGLIENNNLYPFAQDESKATYTFRLERKDLQIEWDQKSSQINNNIRAYSASPGCYCYLNKKRIKVLQAELPADDGAKTCLRALLLIFITRRG
ncbi:MAG: formyltransferase family protein [Actinomycetota bacterium]|nr:formyltransferase family protein [Actinomycetota bacterium]